ncbi:hypothetical protein BJP36_34855 [Moorena producens JHB]|uniref:Nucleotide-diphospho-sugar transferase domain-containing protein n=1 Tax=Moorena producens (strain JHB) TaxID=1454205 RepID=A0A1D9G9N5_MOOP1|nr:hypothetical protein [Moorena producens]AOY84338.1 hypothetical protein BJP36_34855 [Moorena producens JHB]
MSIPIITLHRGNYIHLLYSLAQAKQTNPKSDIFLIGDESNQWINFVNHENIKDYYSSAKKFEDVYGDNHLSRNNYSYELFCFQRWLILKDFMIKNKLKKCVHIDSDLMIYTNLSEEQVKFEAFDFTLSKKGSGHNSFIKLKGLEDFCELLMHFYTTSSTLEILRSLLAEKRNNGETRGGICDMTLLNQYYQRNADKIGLTSDIINDSVYDANVNISDGFEMCNGMKKIYWIDSHPFCRHVEYGKEIKFNSIHFQGQAKKYINEFYRGDKKLILYNQFYRKMKAGLTKIIN